MRRKQNSKFVCDKKERDGKKLHSYQTHHTHTYVYTTYIYSSCNVISLV